MHCIHAGPALPAGVCCVHYIHAGQHYLLAYVACTAGVCCVHFVHLYAIMSVCNNERFVFACTNKLRAMRAVLLVCHACVVFRFVYLNSLRRICVQYLDFHSC